MGIEDDRAIFKGHERERLREVMTSFPALRSTIFDFDELLSSTLDVIEEQRVNGGGEEGVKECLRRESLILEQEIEQLRVLNDYLRMKLDCDLSPSFEESEQLLEGTHDALFAEEDSEQEESEDTDFPDPSEDEDEDEEEEQEEEEEEESDCDSDEDSDDPIERRPDVIPEDENEDSEADQNGQLDEEDDEEYIDEDDDDDP